MNNSSKNNPCATGYILGYWREELILRKWDGNVRIYSTGIETEHRMPSLWYDHQYRQAMVWETLGYNQPPHTSFFVGVPGGYHRHAPRADPHGP